MISGAFLTRRSETTSYGAPLTTEEADVVVPGPGPAARTRPPGSGAGRVSNDGARFTVRLGDGKELTAERLLVATGRKGGPGRLRRRSQGPPSGRPAA
jgi:hypothetical protein